jgi:Ca-activated chloride channel homolog
VLVDGSVVERQAARVAFETEVRGNIDPGLAEWVQGSVFRTRIYPLPARGGRTVKISYVSDLTVADGAASYLLPMAFSEPLEQLALRVAVARGAAQPSISAGELGAITFASWESQWVAETTLTGVAPTEDLRVAVPLPENAVLVEQTADGERYFAVVDVLPDFEARSSAALVRHAVIVFDASASRREADLDRELALLEAWVDAHSDAELHLVVLRDALQPAVAIPEGPGRGARLVALLRAEPLDGGTDLSLLSFPTDLRALSAGADPALAVDAYVLVSDGLGSLGEAARSEAPGARVYTVSSSSEANHAWLGDVAERSGGMAVNLQRVTDGEALGLLERAPIRLAAIEYTAGAIEAVEAPSLLVTNGRVLLAGRLVADEARLRLTYQAGGANVHTSEMTIRAAAAGSGQAGVVSTWWAQNRLAGLALAPERNRVELLRLGREFNLVTPHTSYLVLETLDQHLRYGIPPAATRPEMLAQFNVQIESREQAVR